MSAKPIRRSDGCRSVGAHKTDAQGAALHRQGLPVAGSGRVALVGRTAVFRAELPLDRQPESKGDGPVVADSAGSTVSLQSRRC